MTNPAFPKEADVVIIGGGIVGCSAAYFLAKRGVQAVLVEKGDLSGEQSGRNWGWTRQQGRNPRELPLAVLARGKWNEFAEELGADLERIQEGSLRLAYTERDMARYETWVEENRQLSLDSTILSRKEVKKLIPKLEGPFLGGAYTPSDGQAEPHKATMAVARAAGELGARLITRCAVENIAVGAGAVREVITERGVVKTPVVVCAAGAWSRRVGRMVGLRLPQRAVRGTVACTTPVPIFTHTVVWGAGVAFRQKRDGTLYIAGGGPNEHFVDMDTFRQMRRFLPNFVRNRRDIRIRVGGELFSDLARSMPWSSARKHPFAHTVGVEPEPNAKTVEATLQNLRRLVPSLGDIGIQRSWAGMIDATPDAVAVIGEVPGVRGFIFATGFSGHGFALGPGAGYLVSELVLGDKTSVDLHLLRYSRFQENDMADHAKTM